VKLTAHGLMLNYESLTGVGSFQLASKYRAPFSSLFNQIPRGALWRMEFGKFYPKRSTGPLSMNHHVNGHVQQISMSTGQDFATVKAMVKIAAIDMGYPFITYRGRAIPKSEGEADSQECGLLIEAAHRIAAELGIKLREES
jgi:hypothetical protein